MERKWGSMSRNGIDQAAGGIDIAIPCYNYGHFLRDCVASTLSQEIPNLRFLIIDNASTDDSVEIAQQLAADDRRVQVAVHRRNLGPHASFNEGVDERQLRTHAYQAVLSGASGQVFGNHPIWYFSGPGLYEASMTWQEPWGVVALKA